MPGIAALGAVLAALEDGPHLPHARDAGGLPRPAGGGAATRLAGPGVQRAGRHQPADDDQFLGAGHRARKLLLDLFDAAGVRVSGGSACSAAKAEPSYVLEAMGLPGWQAASAIRLSFSATSDERFIERACDRIRTCGESLARSALAVVPVRFAPPLDGVTRWVEEGACCYLVADAVSRRCVIVDPAPLAVPQLLRQLLGRGLALVAVLSTHGRSTQGSATAQLRACMAQPPGDVDRFGWPQGVAQIEMGARRLTRPTIDAAPQDGAVYLLQDAQGLRLAFVGDLPVQGDAADPGQAARAWRQQLRRTAGPRTLLLPAHDIEDRFASTLEEQAGGAAGAAHDALALSDELSPAALQAMLLGQPDLLLIDVREPHEQALGSVAGAPGIGPVAASRLQCVPLSGLVNALPGWLSLPPETPLLFFCRSGGRSAKAARALRRLGHLQSWSLAGGLALWPAGTVSAQEAETRAMH